MRSWWAVLPLLLAACSFELDFAQVQCASDLFCPSGWYCSGAERCIEGDRPSDDDDTIPSDDDDATPVDDDDTIPSDDDDATPVDDDDTAPVDDDDTAPVDDDDATADDDDATADDDDAVPTDPCCPGGSTGIPVCDDGDAYSCATLNNFNCGFSWTAACATLYAGTCGAVCD
jgi:hypothetical protein